MEKSEFPHPIKGQLKLLLGEILFFNFIKIKNLRDHNKKIVFIYIGSSPGTHINILLRLFEHEIFSWYFIDPRPTKISASELKRIYVDKGYANKNWSVKFFQKFPKEIYDYILISDIRSNEQGKEVTTEDLLRDYSIQDELVQLLNPLFTSLKWRCPFPDQWISDFSIYSGNEIVQAFTNKTSAELRLFLTQKDLLKDKILITKKLAEEYEEKLCYFNFIIRKKRVPNFNHPVPYHDFYYLKYVIEILNQIAFKIPERIKDQKNKIRSWENFLFENLSLKKYFY